MVYDSVLNIPLLRGQERGRSRGPAVKFWSRQLRALTEPPGVAPMIAVLETAIGRVSLESVSGSEVSLADFSPRPGSESY